MHDLACTTGVSPPVTVEEFDHFARAFRSNLVRLWKEACPPGEPDDLLLAKAWREVKNRNDAYQQQYEQYECWLHFDKRNALRNAVRLLEDRLAKAEDSGDAATSANLQREVTEAKATAYDALLADLDVLSDREQERRDAYLHLHTFPIDAVRHYRHGIGDPCDQCIVCDGSLVCDEDWDDAEEEYED